MNYTYKKIWLIAFPVMMSILMEQLINIYGCCFLRPRWRDRIRSVRYRRNLLFSDYMLGFGFSIGLQVMVARRNGEQDYKETGKTFFKAYFPFGIGYLSLPSHSYGFPIYTKEADRFLGYLSSGNSILGLA